MVIIFLLAIAIIVLSWKKVDSFFTKKIKLSRYQQLHATVQPTVTVRFINTPNGMDVIVPNVDQNSILLAVGDNAGVKLPRACRTGLCGSCTCDIKAPTAVESDFNPRAGFLTIRACSSRCVPPEGMDELVVDVGRMRKIKKKVSITSPDSSEKIEFMQEIDPMSRFADNWETDFKASWTLVKEQQRQLSDQQLVPYTREGGFNPKEYRKRCVHCNGSGQVVCDHCEGEGRMMVYSGMKVMCARCAGSTTCGCGYCRGTGRVFKKIPIDSSDL